MKRPSPLVTTAEVHLSYTTRPCHTTPALGPHHPYSVPPTTRPRVATDHTLLRREPPFTEDDTTRTPPPHIIENIRSIVLSIIKKLMI